MGVSRPNSHCILETAGYYEHEMFLPPSFPRHRYPRLSLASCLVSYVPASFSVCFLTGTNDSLEREKVENARFEIGEKIGVILKSAILGKIAKNY